MGSDSPALTGAISLLNAPTGTFHHAASLGAALLDGVRQPPETPTRNAWVRVNQSEVHRRASLFLSEPQFLDLQNQPSWLFRFCAVQTVCDSRMQSDFSKKLLSLLSAKV